MNNAASGWPVYRNGGVSELASSARLASVHADTARDARGRFLTGNSGGGRKRGSRNRLTETFIAAIEYDFAEHGSDALAQLRADDPATYLRIVASLVPRDLIIKRELMPDYSDYSLQELEEILKQTRQNVDFERALERARKGS